MQPDQHPEPVSADRSIEEPACGATRLRVGRSRPLSEEVAEVTARRSGCVVVGELTEAQLRGVEPIDAAVPRDHVRRARIAAGWSISEAAEATGSTVLHWFHIQQGLVDPTPADVALIRTWGVEP